MAGWNYREVRALRSLWPDFDAVAERTGRTRKAVRLKAQKLGMKINTPHVPWTDKDRAYAINSTDKMTKIARKLKRTKRAVIVVRAKHRAKASATSSGGHNNWTPSKLDMGVRT